MVKVSQGSCLGASVRGVSRHEEDVFVFSPHLSAKNSNQFDFSGSYVRSKLTPLNISRAGMFLYGRGQECQD